MILADRENEGERGQTLSGGQRQRIALARALLTDPGIMLLDDATSAVDPGVEAEILATLRQLIRGRTTVLIAHRRSTLSLADRIAVLDNGRVADIGGPEQQRVPDLARLYGELRGASRSEGRAPGRGLTCGA